YREQRQDQCAGRNSLPKADSQTMAQRSYIGRLLRTGHSCGEGSGERFPKDNVSKTEFSRHPESMGCAMAAPNQVEAKTGRLPPESIPRVSHEKLLLPLQCQSRYR